MPDDRSFADSGSYALDAMDEGDRVEFERQLAGSEELRNEVTELIDTAAVLGLAVEPVAPPSELRRNVMARLDEFPQRERDVVPLRVIRAVPAPVQASIARWYRRPAVAITAAAAAVLLIGGAILGASVAIQGAATSQRADALAEITAAPDSRRAEASVASGGSVTLVWSLDLGRSALIGRGMKSLPSGKTYELWYIGPAGKPRAAGLFESDGGNTVQLLSGHLAKGDTVGVTVEPSGGSKAPTTKPVVAITSA